MTEVYDPATDTWATKKAIAIKPFMDRGWRCASVVAEGQIHVIGAFPLSNSHQIYDPSTDRWSLGTPVISGYWFAAAVATTGENAPKRLHVFGATDHWWNLDDYPSSTSQSYDLQTGRWTVDAPVPSRRINVAVAVVNDLIYAIGGFTPEFGNQIRDSAVNEQYIPVGYYGTVHNTPAQTDDVPPAITISSPENKTYNMTEIPLSFNVNESGSWMRYTLDGDTPAELDGNTTITGLISGSHSLTVYATDAAGNTGTSETVYFTVALPESFPTTLAITASGASLAIVGIGLLFYYRKRKRGVVQE